MGKQINQEKMVEDSAKSHVMGFDQTDQDLQGMMWRVDRLERQIGQLTDLIREHAVDADRLVQIVAENREILHQELTLRLSASGKSKKTNAPLANPIELLSS